MADWRERARAVTMLPSRWPAWIDAILVAMLCVVVAVKIYGVDAGNIAEPLRSTGDGGSAQYIIKTVIDHGWYTRNPDVGAPFGATMYDYPIPEPTHFIFIRALGFLSDDPFVVYNLFFLLSFASVAIAAWWALRFLGGDRCTAFAGAFLFTMLPYHFLRIEHVYLASYFAVPIIAAYAARLSLYRAPHVRNELRLTAGAIAIVAVAAGGGVYYAFFGVMLIAVGAILGTIQSRHRNPLWIGGALATVIAAVIAVSLAPNWIYHAREGANPIVAQRSAQEAEFFGLRITQLLLPSIWHRLDSFRAFASAYNSKTPLINENAVATLGLIGGFGLVASLAIALSAWRTRFPRIAAFGALSLVMILFATLGGFGSLFALLVTPEMRGLNRISVYIGFCAIASFFFLARHALRKRPGVFFVVALLAVIGGAFDQIPLTGYRDDARFRARRAFFAQLQTTLPPGTAVFELPYMFFPEGQRTGSLTSYALFEPYLYTHGFRWSFGDMHGRPSDLWYEQASTLHGASLASSLANAGFGAIYLDRRGYPDGGAAVEKDLAATFGAPILEDAQHTVAVYRVIPLRASIPFVVVAQGRGWLPWTSNAKGVLTGSALAASTDLVVANPGRASTVEVGFTLASQEARHISIRYGDLALGGYDLSLGKPQTIAARFVATPGVSRLQIESDAHGGAGASNPPYRITDLDYGTSP